MSVDEVLRVTSEEKKGIKKSLDRKEGEIIQDVTALREWLQKQRHLPQNLDDYLMEKMLRLNKGSLEKTKRKIDNYFSLRNLVPEVYDNRSPLSMKMQQFMEIMQFFPYPKLTNDFCRIYVAKFKDADPVLYDMEYHMKYGFAMLDLRLHFDDAESEIYIMDFSHMKFGHIIKMTPVAMKKVFTLIIEAYSDRIKGMHFLNMPPLFNSTFMLIKALLNDKLSSRVLAHKDLESLYKLLPKEYLPKDYGGNQPPIDDVFAKWKIFLESKSEWLVEQAAERSNEKCRDGDPIDIDCFGSMHGSFRSLTVD